MAPLHRQFATAETACLTLLGAVRDGSNQLRTVELAQLWGRVSGARIPRLVAPMWLARAGAPFVAGWSRLRGQRPLFTSDSLRVLRNHRRISHACADVELGHNPRPLEETLRDTYQWFKQAGKLV